MSISKLIMYLIYGFIFVWIMFALNITDNNPHLNEYMPQYILVSVIYILILNMLVNLLEYIKDNYV